MKPICAGTRAPRSGSSKRDEIRRVLRDGKVLRGRHVTVRARLDAGETATRPSLVTFAIPKSAGGAVVRNRLRRRLRAVVDESRASLGEGRTLVISYHKDHAELVSFQEVADELRRLLANLGRERVEAGG